MKYGFYFRFYKVFKNEFICVALSNFAYFLYILKFIFKKLILKKQTVNLSYDEARTIVNDIYPKPESKPIYSNCPINSDIDLSIVIPVYNYADILENNIISVLNQKTKYNYEVIFVDDGSTDGAKDILKKYEGNPKVKLVFQENGGIASARNAGINISTGKYLMFVDCDDTVHDDIVENLISRAYENDYDMVVAAHNLAKENNGKVYSVLPNVYPKSNLAGYKNGDEIMNLPGLPWAKVYKRELWDNVRFFPGYWYEDTIILPLIFTQCKSYAYVPKVVYEYRWYESNFSHTQGKTNTPKVIDRYWLLLDILEKYTELDIKDEKVIYTLLLRHLSSFYYQDIRRCPEAEEAMFVLAEELYQKWKPDCKVRLPFILRQVEKAFDKKNINLWRLASCYN